MAGVLKAGRRRPYQLAVAGRREARGPRRQQQLEEARRTRHHLISHKVVVVESSPRARSVAVAEVAVPIHLHTMPLDFSKTLVVGISSTALFELSEADLVFRDEGISAYRQYMLDREEDRLEPGTAFPLAQALLALNGHLPDGHTAFVEVVVMSRNSPETGVRIMKSVRSHGLAITRFAFTGGEALSDYIDAFSIDLFLSTSASDVQAVVDAGTCATALLYAPPKGYEPPNDQVRIAFDADAVLFNEDSEVVYKTQGLPAFHKSEDEATGPLPGGPHAKFLRKLSQLQERLPDKVEYSNVRLAVVTARNAPAELRVVATLREWGVYVDAAFFLGGMEKGPVLKALRPHIFFDDQERHVQPASEVVPSGRVPYRSGSVLNDSQPLVIDEPSPTTIPHTRSRADSSVKEPE